MTARRALPVDVIIPCYNTGSFLAEAMESALGQTYPDTLVTVVDDGSTDDTPNVASQYLPHVRYLRTRNAGRSAARNAGIRATSGKLMVFLDADDRLEVDAVERHVEAARATPWAGVFYGSWRRMDVAGEPFGEVRTYPLAEDPFHRILEGHCPPCNSLLVRRDVFSSTGLFDESLPLQEDWDMWLRAAGAGHRFVPVPGAMALYRQHSASATVTADAGLALTCSLRRAEKSRSYHPGCPECRSLLADYVRVWREDQLHLLKGELVAAGLTSRLPGALLRALVTTARAPALVPLMARGVRRRLRGDARD